jgi:hypothetical protein
MELLILSKDLGDFSYIFVTVTPAVGQNLGAGLFTTILLEPCLCIGNTLALKGTDVLDLST